jgi:hypothetical protein
LSRSDPSRKFGENAFGSRRAPPGEAEFSWSVFAQSRDARAAQALLENRENSSK